MKKNVKNLTKRGFALFIALVMCLSVMSLTAFAEDGDEAEHPHDPVDCATCGGTGQITETEACPDCGGEETEVAMVTCEDCDGDGWIGDFDWSPCPDCNGAGSGATGCGRTLETEWGTLNVCYFGYEIVISACETCNGTGQVPDPDAAVCETCGGYGTVEVENDCPDCGGEGKVACTGEFVGVRTDRTTMTYTCATCGASYTGEVEDVSDAEVAENLSVSASVNQQGLKAGDTATYTVTVTNKNSFDVSNVTVKVALDGRLTVTSDNEVTISASSVQSDAADAEENEEPSGGTSTEVTLTFVSIPANGTASETIKATVLKNVDAGELAFSVLSASMEEVSIASDNINTDSATAYVTQYNTATILLEGAKMGRWYQYVPSTSEDFVKLGTVLDALEGKTMSFESLNDLNSYFSSMNYTDSQGVNITSFAEYVPNYASGKNWQCVGFVPITYYGSFRASELLNYVFSDDSETNADFQTGGLEAAKAYVTDNGGILYGKDATSDFVQKLASNIHKSGYTQIMTVWYVPNVKVEPTMNEDGTIATVDKIEEAKVAADQPSSDGVTVDAPNVEKNNGVYTANLTVTIDPDAPNDVHVNLSDALSKAFAGIMSVAGNIQPGDTMKYNITIDNRSGKVYRYVNDSGYIATVDYSGDGDETGAVGFDGYAITSYTLDVHSSVPRRMSDSAPLKELGIKEGVKATDVVVGAALKKLGYGDDNMTDADATQKYLGRYYLDWTNAQRKAVDENAEPATSFQDLTIDELKVFTNGSTGTAVDETCPDVLEALYYFYYEYIYTFNGKGLYDHMKDESDIDGILAAAYSYVPSSSDTTSLPTTAISGEYANNAFQVTKVGFRMGFDLSYTPNPIPETEPEPVSVTIPVTKEISGIESTEEAFAFVLTDADGDELDNLSITGAGDAAFGAIEYTADDVGDHTYIVTEVEGDAENWTYDESVWTVTVTVALDEATNELTAAITGLAKDDEDSDIETGIVFSNTYGVPDEPGEPGGGSNESNDPDPTPTPSNPSTPTTPDTPNNPDTPVDVPEPDVPLADVPEPDVPLTDVPVEDVPQADIPEPDVPLTDVPDEDVPQADIPEPDVPLTDVPDEDVPLTEIPEPDVPQSDVPQTGDNFAIWFVMLLLSGFGLAWLALTGKKRVG